MKKKKRILYVSQFKIEKTETDGVAKKIKNQISALLSTGYDVDYVFTRDNGLYLKIEEREIFLFTLTGKPRSDIQNMFRKLTTMIHKENILEDIAYVYTRKTSTTISSMRFLKDVKLYGVKNILEIPVYPYKKEKIKSFKSYLAYYQDYFLNLLFAKKYIDLIVNYNGYKMIFGVQAIPITNGIQVTNIPVNKSISSNIINIGTVSSMGYWHGYDRIIEGLNLYYKNGGELKIKLHLVGFGPETVKYKELCQKYDLNKHVTFYNNLGGIELDEIYRKFNIGIIALGIHRKGLDNVSSIKTAEFCARGIPFIYAGNEEGIHEDDQFAMQFPNDDSPIDINSVVEFHNKLKINNDIRLLMREVADSRFSWNTQFNKVFMNL